MNTLLRRLKLWQKFAILGALGLGMCAVPLVSVVQTQNTTIAVAEAEDAGLDPVRTALALQRAIHAHAEAAAHATGGQATASAELPRLQAAVDKAMGGLRDQLKDEFYASAAKEVEATSKDWQTLVRKLSAGGLSGAESATAHKALLSRNLVTLDLIADGSGLSLDPVAESYYLMTAVVDHLPRLLDQLEAAANLSESMLVAGKQNALERAELMQAEGLISLAASRGQAQIGKAMSIAPDTTASLKASAAA